MISYMNDDIVEQKYVTFVHIYIYKKGKEIEEQSMGVVVVQGYSRSRNL